MEIYTGGCHDYAASPFCLFCRDWVCKIFLIFIDNLLLKPYNEFNGRKIFSVKFCALSDQGD